MSVYLGSMNHPDKIYKNPIFFILLLGLIIRVAFLISYYASPDWARLVVDADFHHRWAMAISGGEIIGHDAFIRGPLYVYLLGAVYFIFGPSLLAARILGMIIGLASVWLTYLIAFRLCGQKTALWAAMLHAFYPVLIYFESELLVEPLFLFLMECSILYFLKALESFKPKPMILTGIFIGLAAIARPIILGLVPLYLIWLFVSNSNRRQNVKAAAIIVISMIFIIAPVSIRNLAVSGQWTTVAASGGINLYIGNNPQADGVSAVFPGIGSNWEMKDIRQLAEKQTGKEMTTADLSSYFGSKAEDWILGHPLSFAGLYLKKLYFCLTNREISNNRYITPFLNQFYILKYNPASFGIIFFLAVVGVVSLAQDRKFSRNMLFIVLFIACYFLLISLFFVNARFRIPVIPLILIFAGAGVSFAVTTIIEKGNYKGLFWIVPVAVAVGLISYTSFFNLAGSEDVSVQFRRANYYLHAGKYSEAEREYRNILKTRPDYPGANLNLGILYHKIGQVDSARALIKRELVFHPDNTEACVNLANVDLVRDNFPEAVQNCKKALSLDSTSQDAYAAYVTALTMQNDSLGLQALLPEIERNVTEKQTIYYEIGMAYSGWGLYDKAAGYLSKSFAYPGVPIEEQDWSDENWKEREAMKSAMRARAGSELGYLYGMKNMFDSSIYYSSQALALDSNIVKAYANLIAAYMGKGDRAAAYKIVGLARVRFPVNQMFINMERRLRGH